MNKRRTLISITAAFIILLPVLSHAQSDWRPYSHPYFDLNLTSEQIGQIQKLELEFRKEVLPLETKLDARAMELRSFYAYRATGEKIEAKLEQIKKIEIELDKKYAAHNNQIRELLTEKQKEIFDRYEGLGIDLGRMYAMDYGRRYGPAYGRGYGYLGRGWDRDYGPAYGRGWNRGYGRGYGPGYGRFHRGYYGRGYEFGRGWNRGYGMGRGYWCPYYRRGTTGRFRNW